MSMRSAEIQVPRDQPHQVKLRRVDDWTVELPQGDELINRLYLRGIASVLDRDLDERHMICQMDIRRYLDVLTNEVYVMRTSLRVLMEKNELLEERISKSKAVQSLRRNVRKVRKAIRNGNNALDRKIRNITGEDSEQSKCYVEGLRNLYQYSNLLAADDVTSEVTTSGASHTLSSIIEKNISDDTGSEVEAVSKKKRTDTPEGEWVQRKRVSVKGRKDASREKSPNETRSNRSASIRSFKEEPRATSTGLPRHRQSPKPKERGNPGEHKVFREEKGKDDFSIRIPTKEGGKNYEIGVDNKGGVVDMIPFDEDMTNQELFDRDIEKANNDDDMAALLFDEDGEWQPRGEAYKRGLQGSLDGGLRESKISRIVTSARREDRKDRDYISKMAERAIERFVKSEQEEKESKKKRKGKKSKK